MDYITINKEHTIVQDILDTSGGETITYQVIAVSDGSVFASGSMTYLTGNIWKMSFTPTERNEVYAVVVSYAAKDYNWTQVYKCVGLGVTTPTAGDTYCDVDDIRAMLKGITISDTTKITTTEVEELIQERSRWIDSKLVGVYTVPITDSEGLVICRNICKKIVAADVLKVLFAGTDRDVPTVTKDWTKEAIDDLKEYRSRRADIEVTEASSQASLTGEYDEDGDEYEANFKIGMDF